MILYLIITQLGFLIHLIKDFQRTRSRITAYNLTLWTWLTLTTTEHFITLITAVILCITFYLDGSLTFVFALTIGYCSDSVLKWIMRKEENNF